MSDEPVEASPLSQYAYTLPEQLQMQEQDLAVLHTDLIHRMRREMTTGRPASTLTEMLIERTATTYVLSKRGENTGRLDDPRTHKEVTALFLSLAASLQRATADTRTADEVKTRMSAAFMSAADRVTAAIDPDTAYLLRNALAEEFERVEM